MALGRVRRSEISESLSAPHFTEIPQSDYSLSMRTLFIIPLVLMSLVSFPSWGETVDSDDVVMRDGLIYEKFTQTPFTGEITSLVNGKVKNGKKEGIWVFWGENGQLGAKGMYVNNRNEGYWVHYLEDGTLNKYLTGTYKNGEKVSD